ncbi:protein of unknown function [Shewanella benthica]|uniref:Uncharacterized protein n=1 Tax=Shewanella benthica TaxID=43661 RepID=A0A330M389_9GAMM|nr:protein of unknown function [Shewanella benthica]
MGILCTLFAIVRVNAAATESPSILACGYNKGAEVQRISKVNTKTR